MAATKKRPRAKSRTYGGPGMPAVLGVMTVLVLLVGGWVLAGGNVGGFVRGFSKRVGNYQGSAGADWSSKPTPRPTRSTPTPIPTAPAQIVIQDDGQIRALEAQLAEKDTALSAKDAEIQRLQTDMNALQARFDNLRMEIQMLKAELKREGNSG